MVRRPKMEADNGYCTSDNDPVFISKSHTKYQKNKISKSSATDQLDLVGDEPEVEYNKRHSRKKYKWDIVWRNVIFMAIYHIMGVYGLFLGLFRVHWGTFIFTLFWGYISAIGVTAGAHRLWAHKSYKANFPLRLLLILFNNIAFQNSIIEWSRDHRVHHKFTETDADPHNAERGFFFSHMGWLLVRKHKDVKEKGKVVSVQDLWDDPMLAFQDRHYVSLTLLFSVIIPTLIPMLCFGECFWWSFLTAAVFRNILSLNYTWCVNSVAHLWGHRPYDKRIGAKQSAWTAAVTLGEGWHNFHHKFPRDYRASEYPSYWFNPTKSFIDFFIWIGWAYDQTITNQDTIIRMKSRHGDGTQ